MKTINDKIFGLIQQQVDVSVKLALEQGVASHEITDYLMEAYRLNLLRAGEKFDPNAIPEEIQQLYERSGKNSRSWFVDSLQYWHKSSLGEDSYYEGAGGAFTPSVEQFLSEKLNLPLSEVYPAPYSRGGGNYGSGYIILNEEGGEMVLKGQSKACHYALNDGRPCQGFFKVVGDEKDLSPVVASFYKNPKFIDAFLKHGLGWGNNPKHVRIFECMSVLYIYSPKDGAKKIIVKNPIELDLTRARTRSKEGGN
jgi:hypothetical protein